MYLSPKNIVYGIDARITGPMGFRFIFQPLSAVILGIRDGIADAKAGRPPFLAGLVFKAESRKHLFRSACRTLFMPVIFGSVLDAIAQWLLFSRVRPGAAIFVGIFIMALPYSFARGWTNRLWRKRFHPK
ncbi:MAG: hypothetical protein ABIH18_04445 [Candidatus Omnitrophota bacterium]